MHKQCYWGRYHWIMRERVARQRLYVIGGIRLCLSIHLVRFQPYISFVQFQNIRIPHHFLGGSLQTRLSIRAETRALALHDMNECASGNLLLIHWSRFMTLTFQKLVVRGLGFEKLDHFPPPAILLNPQTEPPAWFGSIGSRRE